jgi:TonB family protein
LSVACAQVRVTPTSLCRRAILGGPRLIVGYGQSMRVTIFAIAAVLAIPFARAQTTAVQRNRCGGPPIRPPPTARGGVDTTTYSDCLVDTAPALRFEQASYPTLLLRGRIEGSVLMQFVVDTAGRVDSRTIHELRSTHPLFTASSRAAIIRASGRAATLEHRHVRASVQYEFIYRMTCPPVVSETRTGQVVVVCP